MRRSTVLLADDHCKEAITLDEVPHLGRHIGATMRDVPIVNHAAQLFARSINEGLLFH